MKKVNYLILDTETATMPFISDMGLSADEKKKLAIAKPLVYDIGWTIANRTDGIVTRKNYLVAETFAVPSVFNTAYYKDKRPLYLEMLRNDEITIMSWNDIIDELLQDMEEVSYVCAYNAMFDFIKAIPFTENYIRHLYSEDYFDWEKVQKNLCNGILNSTKPDRVGVDMENFCLRNIRKPMIDVWGVACANLINTNAYKNECLKNKMLTNSGTYFSTSAESAKRYIDDCYGYTEEHTALADAEIETEILFKALKNGKRIEGIQPFPFKMLGDTIDYVMEAKRITDEMLANLAEKIDAYLESVPCEKQTAYYNRLSYRRNELEDFILNRE